MTHTATNLAVSTHSRVWRLAAPLILALVLISPVSVCTGALLLGAAGFLQGMRATTHPNAYKELEQYCADVVDERIVDSGNIITARGVTSSIDLGLYVVERLAGIDARNRIAAQMDYPYK